MIKNYSLAFILLIFCLYELAGVAGKRCLNHVKKQTINCAAFHLNFQRRLAESKTRNPTHYLEMIVGGVDGTETLYDNLLSTGVQKYFFMLPVAPFHLEFGSDALSDPDLGRGRRAYATCTDCPKSQCRLVAIVVPSGVDLSRCDAKSRLINYHSLCQTTQQSKHWDGGRRKETLYL